MLRKNDALGPNAVAHLRETISTEKTKLRWRLATRTPDTFEASPPAAQKPGKLYEICRGCVAD